MGTWKTRLVNDYIKIIVHVYWNDPVGKLENLFMNEYVSCFLYKTMRQLFGMKELKKL